MNIHKNPQRGQNISALTTRSLSQAWERPFNMRDHQREDMMGMNSTRLSEQARKEKLENQKMYEHNTIGIFWDWENIGIPVPVKKVPELLKKMRKDLRRYGSNIKQTRIYHDSSKAVTASKHAINFEHRRPLELQGWTLQDCACVKWHQTGGGDKIKGANVKEVIDKRIIVDIMEFAYDHYKDGGTVVIISNDADYGYMLSHLQNKGIYVVVVYSANADELTQVGDESLDFSHFIDDIDDNDVDEADNNGLVDPLTNHNEPADDDTASDTGSVVPGMHLMLLKAVEEVCESHEFSRTVCPGKALASHVGKILKASSDIYDSGTFKLRRKKAIRAGLIRMAWLRPDRTETNDQSEKQLGWDILFLTNKGRESLREARHEDLQTDKGRESPRESRHEDLAERCLR